MPTSDIGNVAPIMNQVMRLQPKSVLDLGAGFGKYGVLCREYLDIAHSRIEPSEWRTTIVGVDGFAPYHNDLHDFIYNEFRFEDFTANYERYKGYDLVLLIDSLEHVEKSVGAKMLTTLMLNNKNIIVSCPTGNWYLEQGAVNGNEFECHKAHWTPADFEMLGGQNLYNGICTVYHLKGLNANL